MRSIATTATKVIIVLIVIRGIVTPFLISVGSLRLLFFANACSFPRISSSIRWTSGSSIGPAVAKPCAIP